MATFSPDLFLLADFTNTASILVIIVCSLGMVLFIYLFRLTGDLSHRTVDFGPQQRNMVKVSNPFVLELDQSTKQLGDVLQLNVSTLCACHVVVVWGPDIQALHGLILAPGRTVRKKMLDDLEEDTDLQPLHVDVLCVASEGKHRLALPTPECVSHEALGVMPRSRYPLAIFIFTPERGGSGHRHGNNDDTDDSNNSLDQDDGDEKDNDIIGLFVIVHLKDDTVTKDSHVIGKYVKTAGIPIYSLQTLFVSSTEQPQSQHDNDNTSHESSSSTSACSSLRQRNTSHLSRLAQSHSGQAHGDQSQSNSNFDESLLGHRRVNEGVLSEDSSAVHSKNNCDKNSKNNCSDRNDRVLGRQTQTADVEVEESDEPNGHGDCNRFDGDDDLIQGDDSACDDAPDFNSSPIPDCVVCQTQSATCALLPCRHNCVCMRCLRFLENKCPMCRGAVESYFIVGAGLGGEFCDVCDRAVEEEEEENERVIRHGVAAQFENMFERVNQMVGFA